MNQQVSMGTDANPTATPGEPSGTGEADPLQDFAGLVRSHQKALFYFILSLVGDRHRAEDLTQEVFLVAYRRRHDFQSGGRVAAWLYGIARKVVLAELRQRRRRPVPLDQTTLASLSDAFVEAQAATKRGGGWLVGIEQCMGRLDETNRTLLTLRYGRQMSVDEIARDTGSGVSAVKMRLMRLRQRLAECLKHKRGERKR